MFQVVLYQPEIPANTGNIIRLCANTGCSLHLIEPLGFQLTDKHLKRAGLDYNPMVLIHRYESFHQYLQTHPDSNVYLCTTKAKTSYADVKFSVNDSLVFGPETRGLPTEILEQYADSEKIRIPMQHSSRSLNLSNAVAVVVYEAWRQINYRISN